MGLEIIEKLKKELNLTSKQLSEKSGVPKGTLDKILNGTTKDPKLETLKALSRVLGCTLDDFDDENFNNVLKKLSVEEKKHIHNLRKLNDLGKKKVITYTQDLLDNPKFATTNDETCASLVEEDSSPYLVACHDDDLSDEEKNTMNNKINEFLNK